MNPDSSLPIHCPFFVKGFLFFQTWLGRRKQTQPLFFLMMHLGEIKLSLLRKKTNINQFARIA